MKSIKTNTYTLPAYWASALVNGDFSGTNENDIKAMDEFLNKENPGSCVGVSAESWFAWRNDANNIGGDVAKYRFHK